MVTEPDGIERGHALGKESHVLPKVSRGGGAIIKAHTELIEIRGEEGHATLVDQAVFQAGDVRVPVDADRRFARRVGTARTVRGGVDLVARRYPFWRWGRRRFVF